MDIDQIVLMKLRSNNIFRWNACNWPSLSVLPIELDVWVSTVRNVESFADPKERFITEYRVKYYTNNFQPLSTKGHSVKLS